MTTLKIVKRMNSKLELVESKVNGCTINNISDDVFLALFPFKIMEDVDNTEEGLMLEEKFKCQMVIIIFLSIILVVYINLLIC